METASMFDNMKIMVRERDASRVGEYRCQRMFWPFSAHLGF
jgi:hypothetical protein